MIVSLSSLDENDARVREDLRVLPLLWVRAVRAGETCLSTTFFSIKVSFTTGGDEPRLERDGFLECARRDLGDGERADKASHSRTDRGAS